MLFNSFSFIFGFLPIVLIGFLALGRKHPRAAALWLAVASLVFYAWWNPRFLSLLLGSVCFNYLAGRLITRESGPDRRYRDRARLILTVSISVNLLLLGYFKYAHFFARTLSATLGLQWTLGNIVLPIGISFFTFTQIAFLVDASRGKAREYDFVNYLLFVTYFPHLISGPVLHHAQMMPQFQESKTYRVNWNNLAAGLSIFLLGLAKKVVIADTLAPFTGAFDAVGASLKPAFCEAWIGTIAYAFQLYFDFSGYSDMAVGLSLMFNILLPLNFSSPYKAGSIIEFWRRWHMTLSAFLRDYLYFPLGGNRKGPVRRNLNLMITMLLGGLWHGAGWNFVFWGGLHGVYLVVNRFWRSWTERHGRFANFAGAPLLGGVLTFLAVLVAWVFFRAPNVGSSFAMLSGMLGLNGVSLPASLRRLTALVPGLANALKITFDGLMPIAGGDPGFVLGNLGLAAIIIWGFPNVPELFSDLQITCDAKDNVAPTRPRGFVTRCLQWRPTPLMGVVYGIGFIILIAQLCGDTTSPFLYFQF